MNGPFQKLLKEIETAREDITNALLQGSAKEFAQYRELCGEIRGLSRAQMLLTDFVREMENDNE